MSNFNDPVVQSTRTRMLIEKWKPVLEHEDLPKIRDYTRKAHCAVLLENTEVAQREDRQQMAAAMGLNLLTETIPVNSAGTGGYGGSATAGGPVAGFDPILISLIRRNMPVLIGYDVCGVQPMTGPTGLIFAMRSVYASGNSIINATAQNEALYQEANNYGGNTSLTFTTPFSAPNATPGGANTSYGAGGGYPTANGEDMGGSTTLQSMGFSIEKTIVQANTRGLQSGYTLELAQDLKAIHGLDAETELANILSAELLTEINREVIRNIYITAVQGAQLANVAGTYNLAPVAGYGGPGGDTYSRWQVEAYKGLVFQLEREANQIQKDIRREKGNIIIVSSDLGSALAMSDQLDYMGKPNGSVGGSVQQPDDYTQGTFLGVLNGKMKVFVDPYSVSGVDYYVVGYRGANAYDAGLFYCPYVPLQMVRAIDPNTYQPKIGFKTRYGMVANPFAQGYTQGLGALVANSNRYYRKAVVSNIK